MSIKNIFFLCNLYLLFLTRPLLTHAEAIVNATSADSQRRISTPKLEYYPDSDSNVTVLGNVKVVLVSFGSNVAYTNELKNFYQGVTNSKWFDVLSQYGSGRGSFLQSVPCPSCVSSTDITSAFLCYNIEAGNLPWDKNTYYAVHLGSGISTYNVDGNKYSACSTTTEQTTTKTTTTYNCGAIFTFKCKNQEIGFGVIPDMSSSSCRSICGKTNSVLDDTYYWSSGWLASSVTYAWYPSDSSVGTLSTMCWSESAASTYGSDGAKYTVSKLWSNNDGACVAPLGSPPVRSASIIFLPSVWTYGVLLAFTATIVFM